MADDAFEMPESWLDLEQFVTAGGGGGYFSLPSLRVGTALATLVDSLRKERHLHRSTGHCSCVLKLRNLIASGRFHRTGEDIPDEVTPPMLGSMPSTRKPEAEEAEQKARRRSAQARMRLDALS